MNRNDFLKNNAGVFLTLFGLLLASSVHAADWPAWRGPSGDGHTMEKGLPTRWSRTANIRWKVALPDEGNSTPIVWGDRVFLTQASEKVNWPPPGRGGPASAYRRALMCFDRTNGKLLWNKVVLYKEKEATHPTNPFCSASPVTDGKYVIASMGSAGAICCDLDGQEIWRKDLGQLEQIWGNASSPIIYGDLAILWCGPGERQFLLAVDKATGNTVWEVNVPGGAYGTNQSDWLGSWSTPIVIRVNDHDELILGVPNKLKGFGPLTGKELWSSDGQGKLVYASAVAAHGVIVSMSGFHGPALAVRPGGRGDVSKTHRLWQFAKAIPQRVGSPVIVDKHIYILNDNGIPQCFELESGKEVWNHSKREGGSWSAMVASADGRLYVNTLDGDTLVLAASPRFELLARNSLGERTLSSVAVANGDLFIRTYKHLWCVGAEKP